MCKNVHASVVSMDIASNLFLASVNKLPPVKYLQVAVLNYFSMLCWQFFCLHYLVWKSITQMKKRYSAEKLALITTTKATSLPLVLVPWVVELIRASSPGHCSPFWLLTGGWHLASELCGRVLYELPSLCCQELETSRTSEEAPKTVIPWIKM